MKRSKRILALFLSMVLLLGMLPMSALAADSTFSDVKTSDWFYDDVRYVCENGLMNGTGSGTFSPKATTTRGMIVTILYRLSGEPAVSGVCPFGDVAAGKYYEKAITWAAENKIVSGYADGTFGPDNAITREQLAAILYRYATFCGYAVTASAEISRFADAGTVGSYALTAMKWASAEGLINGSGSKLDPKGSATRAQVAAILARFCKNIAGASTPASKPASSTGTILPPAPNPTPDPDPTPNPDPNPTYTVTFDSNGGSAVASQTVVAGQTATEPEAPTKEEFIFSGWYSDSELKIAYDFSSLVTCDITLYAKWIPLIYDETDSDDDGLYDFYEVMYGTDINCKDTDGDGLSDYEEIILGFDPLTPNSFDDETDSDADGLTDLNELRIYNTDPFCADTDGDNLTDYDEVTTYGTNPLLKDTDDDGLDDYFEICHGLNPNSICTDGITPDSEIEFQQNTDESCLSSILLSSNNVAIPSVGGMTKGQLDEEVFIAAASDETIKENRSTVGEPISLDASDKMLNGLTLTFDLEGYVAAGGMTSSLAICKSNADGEYELMETDRESDSVSCKLERAGTYFVMDLDLFLSGLGIDITTEYNQPEANLFENASFDSLQGINNVLVDPTLPLISSESAISGQADVVFVIDTTGSMGEEISGVVSNVTSFAKSLAKDYNVVVNYALIEFKDLEEDGADTTKIIKNGTSNWYSNVTAFAEKVNSLSADGGGDTDECDIDALETARKLDFRSGASKFIILITDAGYKIRNNYGITSLEEEANLLKEDGITTCVVTTEDLKSTYQILMDSTGGIYANINEEFGKVLLQLANGIGAETSGTWVILKHGYRYIRLPENDNKDWDGDGLFNAYELGKKETIDLTVFIKARLALNGIPFEEYMGRTSIEVYNAISDPTREDTDGDGILDKKDTAPWVKGLANGIVGAIKICSYGTGPSSVGSIDGHAFVAYTSFVDDVYQLYGILVKSEDDTAKHNDTRSDRPQMQDIHISSDSLITIGGWADWLPNNLKGTWINNELMLFGDGVPSQQRSLMAYLKSSDVQKFTSITQTNSKWTKLYNCSAYAVDFWNEVTGDNLSARGMAIFRNPASLSNNMEKRSDCKLGDSLHAIWP